MKKIHLIFLFILSNLIIIIEENCFIGSVCVCSVQVKTNIHYHYSSCIQKHTEVAAVKKKKRKKKGKRKLLLFQHLRAFLAKKISEAKHNVFFTDCNANKAAKTMNKSKLIPLARTEVCSAPVLFILFIYLPQLS